MNRVPHEMILASAGTGKTHRLTTRFIRLLALGAAPERIVALTFTRKSAGEFFDRILGRLAAAARDPAAAAELARATAALHLDSAAALAILRGLIDAMPRLMLGTLDAFFARIVRAFPFELGLGGDFELLEGHAVDLERRRVLQRIFAAGGPVSERAQADFIEAFKRATFGTEEKSLAGRLDDFITAHHARLVEAPDGDLWGNPVRIWPRGCPWLEPGDRAAVAVVRRWAVSSTMSDGQRERWADFLEALQAWVPGATLERPLTYLLEKLLEAWDALPSGSCELVIERRKQVLPADIGRALRSLCLVVTSGELGRRLEMTRGMHDVLAAYERAHHETVRRAGRLTFGDVQRLLLPATGAPALALDAAAADDGRRLLIDWRLDGRFDHWLLDEFQDTSREQWSVLENLIDEVVQDPSGSRSFFYVGDVKQAIYGWRGGDARLFREIHARYGGAGGGIVAETLDVSHRSGPPIIDFVNRVFGDAAALAGLFPAGAAARWSAEWSEHRTARPDRTGQAAWLVGDDEAGRHAAALEVLRRIDPLARGLDVAVLVRDNREATKLADFLRREGGLAVVTGSDLHVATDNPPGAALLALFKAAAHPGDTLARGHVRMTPLEGLLAAAGLDAADALTTALLRRIHEEGFEAAVADWCGRLEPHLAPDDAFSRGRARRLVEAARVFDARGGREVAEFVEFLEGYAIAEPDARSVVRVLTLHKAKGLDFDVVILPELEGDSLARRPEGLVVARDEGRDVRWVLQLPGRLVCDADATLRRRVEEEQADTCYEALALLYVGMTRARRGLYVITSPPRSTSKARNHPSLLAKTLGDEVGEVAVGGAALPGVFSLGDPRWFEPVAAAPEPEPERSLPRFEPRGAAPAARLVALAPSRHLAGVIEGDALFAGVNEGAALGAAVHAELASVGWWRPAEGDAWVAARRAAGSPEPAITIARACLDAPALAGVFQAPASGGRVESWRERAFEIAHDGAWISGAFDRVRIERDADGAPRSATVFDFKSDRAGSDPGSWREAARRHTRQLRLYRTAAATLLGLDESRVAIAVVLTNAVGPDGARPGPIPLE